MALSTKNLTEKKANKVIEPGNNTCKILSVKLESVPYKKGAYHMNLQIEGPDLGKDFEGFFVDKADPTKGRHKGQAGRIRAAEYPFSDGETKGGIKVNRDREMMKFIKNLCLVTGATTWFDAQDGQHETIEAFVEKFNLDKPFADKYLRMCICGREYQNREGYTNFDLYLPRPSKNAFPFEAESVAEAASKVYKFNPEIHIKKKKAEAVDAFEKPVTAKTKDQFSLD